MHAQFAEGLHFSSIFCVVFVFVFLHLFYYCIILQDCWEEEEEEDGAEEGREEEEGGRGRLGKSPNSQR